MCSKDLEKASLIRLKNSFLGGALNFGTVGIINNKEVLKLLINFVTAGGFVYSGAYRKLKNTKSNTQIHKFVFLREKICVFV